MSRLAAFLLVLGALSGCDEADTTDTRPDRERIVESWNAATANVRVQGLPFGIPVADLTASGDVQTFTFRPNGTFSFLFDPADGRRVTISYQGQTYVSFPLDRTVSLSGDYTVDEATDQVTFSTIATATADDFRMGYRFGTLSGAGSLELVAEDPETLARLFGLADADAAELARVVTGGSVTYTAGS
ncbi:MAG TPA: hypothetical protein VGB53_00955 [Rubricoccaceae bacterium]|jgi:hypothetical protein